MKFDCSDKFDLCYYGRVNSQQMKSKWARKHLRGNIYFAGNGACIIVTAVRHSSITKSSVVLPTTHNPFFFSSLIRQHDPQIKVPKST